MRLSFLISVASHLTAVCRRYRFSSYVNSLSLSITSDIVVLIKRTQMLTEIAVRGCVVVYS